MSDGNTVTPEPRAAAGVRPEGEQSPAAEEGPAGPPADAPPAAHTRSQQTPEEEDNPGPPAPGHSAAQMDRPPEQGASPADVHTVDNEVVDSVLTGKITATVKIILLPEGHVWTMAFAISTSAGGLREHFASELKIPASVIHISFEGKAVEDPETLINLGVQPHGTIQLEMSSNDPENFPIKPIKPQQEYNMPDVIAVRVQTGADAFQDVVVEIERSTHRKPFLGGYQHKTTGQEFHHAAVQTLPKRRPDSGVEKFCRDTQTVVQKSQSQQVTNTTSTQMTKIGCYVSDVTDRLIEPKGYVTADEHHAQRLKAVIVIQTYTRRWQAKRLTEGLRRDRDRHLEWLEQEEIRKRKEKEDRLRGEYERRMNPKTKEDFDLLYHALEKWRREEEERINAMLSGPERKAALCALLEQETQLIASIGRHRVAAGEENSKKSVQAFLEKCAEPKKWKAFDGKITEMDTQYTIRARELRDLYASINMKHLARDERLDVLLTLKHTVKEHDCKLTRDIVELIDREADLLTRGVKDTNLEGLRKRISTLFLQFIKTPTFNPEVTRLLKVPQDPAQLRKNIHFCPGCKSYLPSSSFSLTATSRSVGRCRQCDRLDNEARRREDFSQYRTILRLLRDGEAQSDKRNSIAFLLQEQDLQYLVDVIWGRQSALSACDDLHDLVLARWDRHCEWAPWNCILLTKDEAVAHAKLDQTEQAYGVVFIRQIKHKHTLAKKHFSQIPAMAQFLCSQESRSQRTLLVTQPGNTVTQA
ncbi:IQ motif and ubiquitin-like domain-containing protein [Amia ocellicauda]|uniref:IQ motif and ubiquitin-like domain-containing protein n=1 Tax=Amia ocellicauda TaxID=2972642 RepID=UPI003463BBC2